MDRVGVFVDAGYFFAAGSALLSETGKQKRSLLALDESVIVRELTDFSLFAANRPLLRIYWYDAAPSQIRRTSEHARLAHCDNVKVRLGFLNNAGQQKGVDSLIVTDLVELARNRAMSDAVLMSGDEDVRIGVQLAQTFGVRVHLLGIKPGRGTQSQQLLHEADTCAEWDEDKLRKMLSIRRSDDMPKSAAIAPTPQFQPRAAISSYRGEHAALDSVVEALIASLTEADIVGAAAYLASNHNSVPAEFDAKLLARSRAACGKDLNIEERRYLRHKFRSAVKRIAPAP